MYQDNLYKSFNARLRTISGIKQQSYDKALELQLRTLQNYWVLDYMVEGEGLFKTSASGRPWRVRKKGEAHLYPPNTTYWERYEKGQSIKSSFIVFQCDEVISLQNLIPSLNHYALFYDDSSILLKLFQKFDTVMLLPDSQQFLMGQSIFWEILLYLTSFAPTLDGNYHLNRRSILNYKSQLIQDVLEWISQNFNKKITMLDLCKKFAISRTALYQKFLEESGETPFANINRLRLKYADDLIMQGYRLKRVAEESGFSSEYHLSKAYKKYFGIRPGRARA